MALNPHQLAERMELVVNRALKENFPNLQFQDGPCEVQILDVGDDQCHTSMKITGATPFTVEEEREISALQVRMESEIRMRLLMFWVSGFASGAIISVILNACVK